MAGNEFDPFDLDSFDFGDFDSLDTGVNVQNQPVATPDVSNIVTSLRSRYFWQYARRSNWSG